MGDYEVVEKTNSRYLRKIISKEQCVNHSGKDMKRVTCVRRRIKEMALVLEFEGASWV